MHFLKYRRKKSYLCQIYFSITSHSGKWKYDMPNPNVIMYSHSWRYVVELSSPLANCIFISICLIAEQLFTCYSNWILLELHEWFAFGGKTDICFQTGINCQTEVVFWLCKKKKKTLQFLFILLFGQIFLYLMFKKAKCEAHLDFSVGHFTRTRWQSGRKCTCLPDFQGELTWDQGCPTMLQKVCVENEAWSGTGHFDQGLLSAPLTTFQMWMDKVKRVLLSPFITPY